MTDTITTDRETGYPVAVCVDCVHVLANGELPDDSAWSADDHADAMDATQPGASDFTLACGEECEGWFSWASCDGCGSTLGGERHPAVVWFPRDAVAG